MVEAVPNDTIPNIRIKDIKELRELCSTPKGLKEIWDAQVENVAAGNVSDPIDGKGYGSKAYVNALCAELNHTPTPSNTPNCKPTQKNCQK